MFPVATNPNGQNVYYFKAFIVNILSNESIEWNSYLKITPYKIIIYGKNTLGRRKEKRIDQIILKVLKNGLTTRRFLFVQSR